MSAHVKPTLFPLMLHRKMFRKIVVTLLLSVALSKTDTVIVNTSKGEIQGYKNDGYVTFFGVPYAMVEEDNPFGNSIDYPNFGTPFNANDSTIYCPQVLRKVGGNLQCLRLNMYVPQNASINNPLPILVWFYGGGFMTGSAGDYGGQHLVKHDIIVITVNYRLGPYGFMCLKDPSAPGNQGFKDQVTALRWIKDHIAVFGGNASRVTIAGESYGGGAVDLHLYSKYDMLFDKAIIQSGSMFTPGFFVKRDDAAAIKLAIYLGHNVNDTKTALLVLAKEHPIAVMSAATKLGLKLKACKEKRFKGVKSFVTKYPYNLNNALRIRKTAIMIGYNSKEDFGTFADKPKEFFNNLGNIFYNNLKNNTDICDGEVETLANITKAFYLGGKSIGPETNLELSDYSSDFKLNYAAEASVNRFVEQGATVYKYLFSYIGGSVYKNVTGAGAIHTEELKYLFEMASGLETDEQKMMRDRMTAMWAQFVKFGTPTPQETDLLPVTWTPVSGLDRPYLNIDVNMTMLDHVYHKRIAFWNLFWQKYDKKSVTY